MTAIKHNTVTITAPCSSTVEVIGDDLYLTDLDGVCHHISARGWDQISVANGATVYHGDVLGRTQFDIDGDLDEGIIQTEAVVVFTAETLGERFGHDIEYVSSSPYVLRVGPFTVTSEYGDRCRVTVDGHSDLISDHDDIDHVIEQSRARGHAMCVEAD